MREDDEVSVENIVASGKLNPELDLANVADDLQHQDGISEVEHSRNSGNRLLIYFDDNDALCILTPSSVYVVTGVNNQADMNDAEQILLSGLSGLGIISSSPPPDAEVVNPFEIQNVVCTGDLERDLNLGALSIGLGLENTEYEPEQFPGLVYKPDTYASTILLFASGKVVITGAVSKESAEESFEAIKQEVDEIFR